jgi:hypothetical protein
MNLEEVKARSNEILLENEELRREFELREKLTAKLEAY